jgi:hypothetical protein
VGVISFSEAEGGSIFGSKGVKSGTSSLTTEVATWGSGSTRVDKPFGDTTSSTGDGTWDTTDPESCGGEGLAFE